jgi:hypothetical protein
MKPYVVSDNAAVVDIDDGLRGITEPDQLILRTDNGPQFTEECMQGFPLRMHGPIMKKNLSILAI